MAGGQNWNQFEVVDVIKFSYKPKNKYRQKRFGCLLSTVNMRFTKSLFQAVTKVSIHLFE
jgi:hypothetical protein